MKAELQNKLYKKYPKIFRQKDLSSKETCMCWGIACGNGWYNIIDKLCERLQHFVDYPREQIEYYKDKIKNSKDNDQYYQNLIDQEKEKVIPQIEAVQVKEKYGTLRFYLSGYPENRVLSARVREAISFAESMSSCTCENCGMPGSMSTSGWRSVSCEPCAIKQIENRQKFFNEARQLKIPFGDK